ncbi:hypothetical protein [Burkholderia ubonensis]|uniref:hypothetical protein n=1 Tax=Burkholderia ubonensis TaxID=101571 RepID=UPI0008FE456C|nr:hypothetical protein [Burkholderia ubonensis]OJA55498.1 hypothetical protein BGV69_20895 [Burkholderia ubonensis]
MSINTADAWAYLKTVPNIVQILVGFAGALLAALIAASVSLINMHRQLKHSRDNLKHAKDTLNEQRTANTRSAATFIADKRQQWIDELRADMATHLAESQEIMWKWAAIREDVKALNENKTLTDAERREQLSVILAEFSKTNGELDRKHQERHFRLRFRLNPNPRENKHVALRTNLDEIRSILVDSNPSQPEPNKQKQTIFRVKALVTESDSLTTAILKEEWDRVKQEVAYPEWMVTKIPPP